MTKLVEKDSVAVSVMAPAVGVAGVGLVAWGWFRIVGWLVGRVSTRIPATRSVPEGYEPLQGGPSVWWGLLGLVGLVMVWSACAMARYPVRVLRGSGRSWVDYVGLRQWVGWVIGALVCTGVVWVLWSPPGIAGLAVRIAAVGAVALGVCCLLTYGLRAGRADAAVRAGCEDCR